MRLRGFLPVSILLFQIFFFAASVFHFSPKLGGPFKNFWCWTRGFTGAASLDLFHFAETAQTRDQANVEFSDGKSIVASLETLGSSAEYALRAVDRLNSFSAVNVSGLQRKEIATSIANLFFSHYPDAKSVDLSLLSYEFGRTGGMNHNIKPAYYLLYREKFQRVAQ